MSRCTGINISRKREKKEKIPSSLMKAGNRGRSSSSESAVVRVKVVILPW